MAISPKDEYPAQIDVTDPTGYPEGKAQNVVSPGSGDGTPWEKKVVNDMFGMQQALLADDGATPSGTPDKVGASQYFDAISGLADRRIARNAARNWTVAPDFTSGDGTPDIQALAASDEWWLAVGAGELTGTLAGVLFSRIATDTWSKTATLTFANTYRSATYDPVNNLFIIGGDGGRLNTAADPSLSWGIQTSQISTPITAAHSSGTGVTVLGGAHDGATDMDASRSVDGTTYASVSAMPGSAGSQVNAIVSVGTTFVAVGEDTLGDPLVWISTDDGVSFSVVTPPAISESLTDVTYDGTRYMALGNGTVVASLTGAAAWAEVGTVSGGGAKIAADPASGTTVVTNATGFQISIDGGVTWGASPSNRILPAPGNPSIPWPALHFNGEAWAVAYRSSAGRFSAAQSLLVG